MFCEAINLYIAFDIETIYYCAGNLQEKRTYRTDRRRSMDRSWFPELSVLLYLEKDDIEESCETLNKTMKLHDLPDDFCQQSIAPYESNNDQGSTDRLVHGPLGLDFPDFSWSDWFWSVDP